MSKSINKLDTKKRTIKKDIVFKVFKAVLANDTNILPVGVSQYIKNGSNADSPSLIDTNRFSQYCTTFNVGFTTAERYLREFK